MKRQKVPIPHDKNCSYDSNKSNEDHKDERSAE